jgi:MOSC domain-containing protein YiiM
MKHNINIHGLYISPGHAFYGRHGMEPLPHEMVACDVLECVAGSGIRGDRFFDYKPDFKGQVTFFDWAVHEDVLKTFELTNKADAYRRNVVIGGMDLNSLIGRTFQIGDVVFAGIEHCKPCYWMDHACATGVEEFLAGKGGLRAKITHSGVLHPGVQTLDVL